MQQVYWNINKKTMSLANHMYGWLVWLGRAEGRGGGEGGHKRSGVDRHLSPVVCKPSNCAMVSGRPLQTLLLSKQCSK